MRVIFLGTGSALSHGARQNTSLLFYSGGDSLLVDCSSQPAWNLARHGLSLADVRQLVLTHGHVDHVYAVPSLVHSLWLEAYPGGGRSLTVIARQSVLMMVQRLLDVFDLEAKTASVKIEYFSLPPGIVDVPVVLNGWRVQSFDVPHAGIEAIGLVFTKGERSLVFTGDSSADGGIQAMFSGSTMLIHDCGAGLKPSPGHASAQEIAAILDGVSIEKLVLSHLPDLGAEELESVANVFRPTAVGNVILPTDGDVIEF